MRVNIENLHEMFQRLVADGFDIEQPLKWGFFFFDPNESQLRKVLAELSDYNYTVESFEQSDEGDWMLQLSKTEVLTCDKLHRRNIAFNELAEYCGVALYDGWDVGRA